MYRISMKIRKHYVWFKHASQVLRETAEGILTWMPQNYCHSSAESQTQDHFMQTDHDQLIIINILVIFYNKNCFVCG